MTISYPVRTMARHVIDANGAMPASASTCGPSEPDDLLHACRVASRIAATLNYCQDLTDEQMTEDSAGEVLEDRNRLLTALRELRTAILQQPGGCGEVLAECLRRADFHAIRGR